MRKLKLMLGMALGLTIVACATMLGGCAHTPAPPTERIVQVSVPVTVPCVSGTRPSAVPPISVSVSAQEWAALSTKQKAEAIAAQALRHQNRADAVEAATSGCQ